MKWKLVLLIVVAAGLLVGLFVFSNSRWKLAYYEEQERLAIEGKLYPAGDAVPFNSTYKRYGFYPSERMFISHDGIRYQLRDDGGIRVLDQAGYPQLVYGTGISGNYNGSRIVRTEEDYDWTWEHTTDNVYFTDWYTNPLNESEALNRTMVMVEHTFTGSNNNDKLNWTQEYKFNPKDDVKITHRLTNNWGQITNSKFWYIMKDTGTVRYNGQVYDTSETEINQQGNFNNIVPRLEFFDGGFNYKDLLDDNFDLVHIYMGDGSPLGYDNKRFVGLGFSKGNGNFNVGQSITLDPFSTGFTNPTGHSDPQNQWNNPQNLFPSDNNRADESTVGDNFTLSWDDFDIPDAANITGIEVKIEGTTDAAICLVKQTGRIKGFLSTNNFTTEGIPESIVFSFPCLTSPSDSSVTRGSSTDVWGLNSGGDINGTAMQNLSMRGRLDLGSIAMYVDNVQVNVYWNLPAPFTSTLEPSPLANEIISSTYSVNFSSTQELSEAILETNQTGAWVNHTMELYNNSMNAQITMDGEDNGVDNGTVFAYTVWATSGGDWSGGFYNNITVESEPPEVLHNSPASGVNTYPHESVFFNFTNNDTEEDTVDMKLVTDFGNGYNIRNYIKIEEDIEFEEEFTYNRTTGELDAEDVDLFRYFKMDGLEIFGENSSTAETNLRDFSNNYSLYQHGNPGHTPDFITSDYPTQGGLDFDGSNDNIKLEEGDGLDFFNVLNGGGFSMGGWFNKSDTSTMAVIGKSYSVGEQFFTWRINSLSIWNNTGLACSGFISSPPANEWHHYALSVNETGIDWYYDGAFVEHDACVAPIVLNSTRWQVDGSTYEVYLGAEGQSGTDAEFDGIMDEVFVYNKTLSPREVANIHRPIRYNYDWILRSYQSPTDYTNTTGYFVHYITLINVTTKTTLEDLYDTIQAELPEDPSLIEVSRVPCHYISNQNVDVTVEGELVMESCTLEMNSTSGAKRLRTSGTLTANYSNFSSYTGSSQTYRFYSLEGSSMTLINSYVSHAGENDDTPNRRGLEIASAYLNFFNNSFSWNRGIVFMSNNLTLDSLHITTPWNYNIQNYANNSVVMNSNITGGFFSDMRVLAGSLYVINSNYSTHFVSTNSFLYRQWYVNGKVQNSTSPLTGAVVEFMNVTGAILHTETTNSTGDITQQNVTEYIVNSTGDKIYQTNYSIKASLADYTNNTISFNFTGNDNFVINLTVSGLTCSIDCTLINLVTDSINCGGGLLEFFGLDRTTDYVQVDAVVSNYNRLEIEQCKVIGGENLVP